jgi:hypothetical protein
MKTFSFHLCSAVFLIPSRFCADGAGHIARSRFDPERGVTEQLLRVGSAGHQLSTGVCRSVCTVRPEQSRMARTAVCDTGHRIAPPGDGQWAVCNAFANHRR